MSDLRNPMDCILPGFSVHGISQTIILGWVSISFSRGSSWTRVRTQPCLLHHPSLLHWWWYLANGATREAKLSLKDASPWVLSMFLAKILAWSWFVSWCYSPHLIHQQLFLLSKYTMNLLLTISTAVSIVQSTIISFKKKFNSLLTSIPIPTLPANNLFSTPQH